MSAALDRLHRDGFAIVPDVLSRQAAGSLAEAFGGLAADPAVRARHGDPYGVRNALELVPAARAAAEGPAVRALVEPVIGAGAFIVRAVLFDKHPGANWRVGWHQDLIIPVRERVETPGFRGWSVKAGVPHVHPPAGVLEGMLTVRLHLDDCGPENGPLRVVPGSHARGILSVEAAREARAGADPTECCLEAGGALLMRPLLLHASSPAASPAHRRVLHLEFAAEPLPRGLEWARA